MTLQSITIDGVAIWFADDKPGFGWWHPIAIQPETGSNGEPTASLMEAGDIVIAQCGAQLAAKPQNMAPYISEFSRQMGQNSDDVILSEVGISVTEARLELDVNGTDPEVLARSNSSGMFPFKSMFNATVMGDAAERLREAISGSDDTKLLVVFDMTVDLPFAVAAIENRTAATPASSAAATSASILASFGSAASGAATAARSSAESLVDSALSSMTTNTVAGTASATASFLEAGTNSHPIEITTDAAGWFAAS